MSVRPAVLLFDLGGVLIDFAGLGELQRLLQTSESETALKARWLACQNSEAFGCGQVALDDFADRFIAEWQVPLEREPFLAEFRGWARGWLPDARELLASLRPHYRLAALSNCNPVHWERLVDDLGVEAEFDVAMSSHQLGVRKPDAAIFTAALDRLEVDAAQVLFFDDAAANVEAARALGMQAAMVDGPDGIRRELHRRGLPT
jgi:glucose-1-phosphatase